jgi:uncharacterized protein YhjY with autotransporter beta-barrel domain
MRLGKVIVTTKKLLAGCCLAGITTISGAATSNVDVYGVINIAIHEATTSPLPEYDWDNPSVVLLVNELKALGWNLLPVGKEVDGNYSADVVINLDTHEITFTTITPVEQQGEVQTSELLSFSSLNSLIAPLSSYASITRGGATPFFVSSRLTSLGLNGAHHRPLMSMPVSKKGRCMWVTGDAARNGDADLSQQLVEIGLCGDSPAKQVRWGAGLGFNRAKQGLDFGGGFNFDGNHLVGEVDFLPRDQWLFSILGIYGWGDASTRRNYLSGLPNTIDTSIGDTSTRTWGGRVRVDWLDAFSLAGAPVTPYASVTFTHSRQDSYTEQGGGFPAHFNAVSSRSTYGLIGGSARFDISDTSRLTVRLEAVHDFNQDAPTISGIVAGTLPFNLEAPATDRNYVRLGVDYDHQFLDGSVLSVGLHASDIEPGPAYTGSVSWQIGF